MENHQEGRVVVRGRVEIDMRQPFRSVKEAVSLFGEKVLAGEVYANKLKEMQTNKGNITVGGSEENSQPKVETVVTVEPELEEKNKQSLGKSEEEENHLMAYYLCSLKKELEETKKELQQLKSSRELISDHRLHHHLKIPNPTDPIDNCIEIEELKFIENSTIKNDIEAKTHPHQVHHQFELEKKRPVKFDSPPLLTRVIVSKADELQPSPSVNVMEKKPKRKPLIPVLRFLFSRKKGDSKNGTESKS